MSLVSEPHFKGWSAASGCIRQSLEDCPRQQMNMDHVYLLYILPFFLCMLLIDIPQGGESSDSDTKQVTKENISFKREERK